MHIEDHRTLQALQREEHGEKTARRRLHLRVLVLARPGWEAPRIARAVGLISPTLNPDAVNRFFDQLVKEVDPKGRAIASDLAAR